MVFPINEELQHIAFEITDCVDPPSMGNVDCFHDNMVKHFISPWIINMNQLFDYHGTANISKASTGTIFKIHLAARLKGGKT